jgi:hypothetical protein
MITASGTVSDVVAKVKEYIEHGCTSPLLLPLSGNVEYVVKSISKV